MTRITCEYVGVTRWRVAICGEYMKSRLKTCSRGTACNFIHCFRNPGDEYEWADWDNPPPKHWVIKMAALFGLSDEIWYDKQPMQDHSGLPRNSKKKSEMHERYRSRRSISRDFDSLSSSSSGDDSSGKRDRRSTPYRKKHYADSKKMDEDARFEEKLDFGDDRYRDKNRHHDHDIVGFSTKNTDQFYSRSKSNSNHHSKGRDHRDYRDVIKEYCRSERYEEDRSQTRDSPRKYDKLHSVQTKSYSGRGILDEHIKPENYDSDSHRSRDRRRKSHDYSSGPKFSETTDVSDRWETGSDLPDESMKSTSSDCDDDEPSTERHIPHDQSSGRLHKGIKSRSRSRSSHRSHSKHRKEARDPSTDGLHSREDHKHYHGKHKIEGDYKKHKRPPNEDNSECLSSENSRVKSDIEEKEGCDSMKHKSVSQHSRKHRNSNDTQEEHSKRSRGHTKRKHESIDNDKKTSCKRSRSTSPAQSSSQSCRRRYHGNQDS